VARRIGSSDVGRDVAREVAASPQLELIPTDADLEREALQLGTEHRLRAADALYVAVAVRTGSVLVTTDRELGARVSDRILTVTPGEWLATHAP
jgi:predicted nucleic acid-binding protein